MIGSGVWYVFSGDHGQGIGCVGCGLLGIPLLSWLFWAGSWNVQVIAKRLVFISASRKCDKK